MSKFREYLLKTKEQEAYLLDNQERDIKSKADYVLNAEVGLIIAFRLHFKAKSEINLTKVISGKIIENNKEENFYIVETRNGLEYHVPYSSVVWVKTAGRWPKGVYDEMKLGSVVAGDPEPEEIENDVDELGELEHEEEIDY